MNKLNKIRKSLSRVSAFYFGVFYLLLIPAYALIYYQMPNQFYQSTIKLESLGEGFEKENVLDYEIIRDFSDLIYYNFASCYNHNYIIATNGDTIYEPIHKGVSDGAKVELKGDFLTIPIRVRISKEGWHTLPIKLKINSAWDMKISDDTIQRDIYLDTLSEYYPQREYINSSYQNYDYKILFPKHCNFPVRFSDGNMYVLIDRNLQHKINSLVYGLNGMSFSKDFWNMFYLSAITITTLGFGDFVPITKTARLWVSSEAILGVILIGLFLNSLSKNITKPD